MTKVISDLTNTELLHTTKQLRKKEKVLICELILYLHAVEERGLYRDAGHSSLFSFCVEGLGYSGSAAYRRIQVARSLKNTPELYQALEAGSLTLSTAAELSKVVTKENIERLLKASAHQSKEIVEHLVAGEVALQPPRKRESIRVIRVKKEVRKESLRKEDLALPHINTLDENTAAGGCPEMRC